jgi:hypothetical protein
MAKHRRSGGKFLGIFKNKHKDIVIVGIAGVATLGLVYFGVLSRPAKGHYLPQFHAPWHHGGGGGGGPMHHPPMHRGPPARAHLANTIPHPAGHLPLGGISSAGRIAGSAGIGGGNQTFPRGRMGHGGGYGVSGFAGFMG